MMKHIFCAALALAALATGCKSDDYDDGTSPVANTAYIVEAATTPDAPVTFKRTVETLDREFVVRLVAPVDTPTRVELIVDAEAAAEYNRRHGTSYPVLDAAPGSLTLTVPKGRSGSDPLAIEVLYDETLLNGRYGMMLQPWMLVFHGGTVGAFEGSVAPIPQLGGRTVGCGRRGGRRLHAPVCRRPNSRSLRPLRRPASRSFFFRSR